jgi:hypothetical protein
MILILKFYWCRRFDNNYQLSGPVPSNINNLTKLAELWALFLLFVYSLFPVSILYEKAYLNSIFFVWL